MTRDEKRLPQIDVCKGIGILTVILFHVWDNQFFKAWFDHYQVPVFLFASGLLFHDTDYRSFAKRKFRSLIVPYLGWGLLTMAYHFLIEYRFRKLNLTLAGCLLRGILLGEYDGLVYNSPLWFIPCFLLCQLLFLTVYKVSKRIGRKGPRLIPLLFCAALYIVSRFRTIPINICSIYRVPKLVLWYCIGYYFTKCGLNSRILKCGKPLLGVTASTGAALSILLNRFFPDFDFLICVTAISAVYALALLLRTSRFLNYIGLRTMTVLLIHGPVYRVAAFVTAFAVKMPTEQVRENIFLAVIILSVSLAVSLGADWAKNRIKSGLPALRRF